MHPSQGLVATTCSGSGAWGSTQGEDGQLKLWARVPPADGTTAGGASFWRCTATLGFKGTCMFVCIDACILSQVLANVYR